MSSASRIRREVHPEEGIRKRRAERSRSIDNAVAILRVSPTVDLEDAACCLGISMSKAYRLVKANDFPVPLLRVGARYRVPSRPLLDAMGLDPQTGARDDLRIG